MSAQQQTAPSVEDLARLVLAGWGRAAVDAARQMRAEQEPVTAPARRKAARENS